jgi:hypothetical protein
MNCETTGTARAMSARAEDLKYVSILCSIAAPTAIFAIASVTAPEGTGLLWSGALDIAHRLDD